MKISMRKVSAITWAKTRDLTDKNVIIAPILILGLTVGLRFLYRSMLVFMMLPVVGGFSPSLEKIASVLFTGVASNMVTAYTQGEAFSLGALNIAVLLGEIAAAVGIFIACYRRNGYEAD